MTTPFQVHDDLILLPVRLTGPSGETLALFALDTGATETVVRTGILIHIGYDPVQVPGRVSVATASGTKLVPRLSVGMVEALGQRQKDCPVLALAFPPSARIDGLLVLDFIRGQKLCIDYRTAQITLI